MALDTRAEAIAMNSAIATREMTVPAVRDWDITSPAAARWPMYAALDLGALVTAPGCGRDWTLALLHEWALDRYAEAAEALVSELITNAVLASCQLGGAAVRLSLASDKDELLIMVHDLAPGVPSPRNADEASETGRGLRIVAAVSRQYGWYPTPGNRPGKVVWVLL
jgi:anti-sigma regulatory factor (Ser/Thr protein kinase)